MNMGTLAPNTTEHDWPRDAYTAKQVEDKLTYWAEHLTEAKQGTTNGPLTLQEIRGQLDRWLDEMTERRGR